jgi:hypothetical protein
MRKLSRTANLKWRQLTSAAADLAQLFPSDFAGATPWSLWRKMPREGLAGSSNPAMHLIHDPHQCGYALDRYDGGDAVSSSFFRHAHK